MTLVYTNHDLKISQLKNAVFSGLTGTDIKKQHFPDRLTDSARTEFIFILSLAGQIFIRPRAACHSPQDGESSLL
jgi:hypothetical protein